MQILLITNAQLFVGDDRNALPRDILIVDGLVDTVAEDLSAAEADTVIDVNGRTVTPTLFAGITAAGLSEIGMVYEAVDSRLSDLYTGLMHPEFDVRRAYNPHSTVIPVTRIEGFGYTLLMAAPGDRTISGQGSLVRFDNGFESFEGKTVVYVNVDGSGGNRLGGSRAAHWMLLESAFQELGTDDEDLTLIVPPASPSCHRANVFLSSEPIVPAILIPHLWRRQHKLTAVIVADRKLGWSEMPGRRRRASRTQCLG